MTAILATVRDGVAFLAADSRTSNQWAYRDDADKIVQAGQWLFAVSGFPATASWLRWQRPEQADDESDDAYLFRVALALQAWAQTIPGLTGKDDQLHGSSVLAVHGGRVWTIAFPVCVEHVGSAAAFGDPSALVAAYRCARRHRDDEVYAIVEAIETVGEISATVGGPIQVWKAPPDGGPVRLR